MNANKSSFQPSHSTDSLVGSGGTGTGRSPASADTMVTPGLLDTKSAARYTSLSRQWFEQARHRGDGPPYIKIGRAVRYKRSDLDDWFATRKRRHTAEG